MDLRVAGSLGRDSVRSCSIWGRSLFRHPSAGPAQRRTGLLAIGTGLQCPRNVGQRNPGIVSQVGQPEEGYLIGRILRQHGPKSGTGFPLPALPGCCYPPLQVLSDHWVL